MSIEERKQEIIHEMIRLRHEQGISQKKLEQLSGVKQPVIARTETNASTPALTTIIKLLAPLGKTLSIVSLSEKERK